MIEIVHHVWHFFSNHVVINAVVHALGGFGIAILLQEYISGDAFLPPFIGWLCIILGLVTLGIAIMS